MTTLRLDKLNRVWDGIKSGELKHEQRDFFCGSSACFIGWLVVIEAMEAGLKIEDYSDVSEFGKSEDVETFANRDYWNYAQTLVGLSDLEATLIFSAEASTDIQQATIDALNAGLRFDPDGSSYDRSVIFCSRVDYLQAAKRSGLTKASSGASAPAN